MKILGILFLLPSLLLGKPHLFDFLQKIELTEKYSGMPNIDCIYVINLDKRADRWERMETILSEQGLHANRVRAVNGWELANSAVRQVLSPIKTKPLNKGEIGCFLSHLSIWKDAFDRNFDRIWIMEDDIIFKQDASCLIPIIQSLEEMDPEWDIFYTDFSIMPVRSINMDLPGKVIRSLESIQKQPDISPYFKRIPARCGTFSMLLSKRGVQKILKQVVKNGIERAVDRQIHYTPSLREYTSLTPIVTHSELGTDIHTIN